MKKEDLVLYEMPTIAEFVSIGWMQTIIVHYIAWKVNRKIRRWNKRIEREEFIRKSLTNAQRLMEMKKLLQKLLKEYTDTGGKIFADYFLRIKGDDEIKKSIEANDFMMAFMTGKGLKKEWKLEESDDYKELVELTRAINKLQELIDSSNQVHSKVLGDRQQGKDIGLWQKVLPEDKPIKLINLCSGLY